MKQHPRKGKKLQELKEFLDEQVIRYNNRSFIELDPVSVPHRYSGKQDREISGFLTAVISWGQRPVILRNALRMMSLMDNAPADFIHNAGKKEFRVFEQFVHRTFNGIDAIYFVHALQKIYRTHGGLENVFTESLKNSGNDMGTAINKVRSLFFSFGVPARTTKHLADPLANASAKRINMFLRWMVRNDKGRVDFGIWKEISPSLLYIPLDVHSGRVARELGLLERKQTDWKAVTELTQNLRGFDPVDPVKYDYALFGSGVEK